MIRGLENTTYKERVIKTRLSMEKMERWFDMSSKRMVIKKFLCPQVTGQEVMGFYCNMVNLG